MSLVSFFYKHVTSYQTFCSWWTFMDQYNFFFCFTIDLLRRL